MPAIPVPPPPNPTIPTLLDSSAAPFFGSYDFYPTFGSETVDIPVRGGGYINARDDGPRVSCDGYVNSAPNVEIVLQANTDLYIYFLSGSDSTLIVKNPWGDWYCDDDSYGDRNPMVVFLGATTGIYDIWVGRWDSSGFTQPGTLVIGEQHP